MKQISILALALSFAAAIAVAKEKPAKPVAAPDFVPDWNAAIEEAKATNLPLVVHRHGFY